MMRVLSALIAGVLFGIGLAVSGMTNPAKVIGFIDIAGAWDASLVLVLSAAVVVSGAGYAIVTKRDAPFLEPKFQLPTRRDIDMPLVLGAVVFGAGWGLVGLCPGPAIAGLAFGLMESVVFVAAMIAGMALFRFFPSAT